MLHDYHKHGACRANYSVLPRCQQFIFTQVQTTAMCTAAAMLATANSNYRKLQALSPEEAINKHFWDTHIYALNTSQLLPIKAAVCMQAWQAQLTW